MDWRISVLIHVILYSIFTVFQRFVSNDDDSDGVSSSVFFQLITGIIILFCGAIFGTLNFSFDIEKLWPNIMLMALLYGFGNVFIFKSLQMGSASSFTVYFSLRVFMTIIISYFLFEQSFTALSFVGLALLILGIILVDYSPDIWKISKSELYALLSAICIGVTNATSQSILTEISVSTFLVLGFLSPVLLMMIIYPRKVISIKKYFKKRHIINYFILAILSSIASFFFFKAIQDSNDSSLVTAVSLSSILVTILFAYIFLKERDHFWRKLFAAVVTFGGLLLLA